MAGVLNPLFSFLGAQVQFDLFEDIAQQRFQFSELQQRQQFQIQVGELDLASSVQRGREAEARRTQHLLGRQLDLAALNFEARENTLREQIFSQERLDQAFNFSNLITQNRALDIRQNTISALLNPGTTFDTAGSEFTEFVAGRLQALSDEVPEPGTTFQNRDEARQAFAGVRGLELALA